MTMNANRLTIDLELHKLIEAARASFDETPTDILKRVLRTFLAEIALDDNGSSAAIGRTSGAERLERKRGDYVLTIFGKEYKCNSLKQVLRTALLELEAKKPGLIDGVANHRTRKGRRIVARTPHEIYPGKPQLVRYAEKLRNGWFFDTNISRPTLERYLKVIADAAGIEYGREVFFS